mgnify:CR=1 FL=1|jgi:tRNA(Ile2) C34 agmatinyltransferase TiaS
MAYKLCPNCQQISYSAGCKPTWYCPTCGKDISFIPARNRMPDRRALAHLSLVEGEKR